MSFRQIVALAGLLAIGSVQAETAAHDMVGDAKAGEAKAAACGACHGPDGNSAAATYPKLAGQQESYVARQLQLFKSNTRQNAIMAGFVATLTEQDMHDLGAHFATKRAIPGVADAKLAVRGEQIYRGGDAKLAIPACMACHGPDGRGNPGAGYPQLAGQWTDYISLKLKEWHDGGNWGEDDRAKVMPEIAKRLSAADMAAVSSYIEGLHSVTTVSAAKE
ncbi:MAG: c-type cytochrome [Tahibacter sp.]